MESGKTKFSNYQGTNSVSTEINVTRSKRIEEHTGSSKMCKIMYLHFEIIYLFSVE